MPAFIQIENPHFSSKSMQKKSHCSLENVYDTLIFNSIHIFSPLCSVFHVIWTITDLIGDRL